MQNIKGLGGCKIACCEPEEGDGSQNIEIRYLKLLLEEAQDKNKVLQLNNNLLLDKIEYLEEKITYLSENPKIEPKKKNTNENITNESKVQSVNTKSKSVRNMEAMQTKINTDKLQPPVNPSGIEESNPNEQPGQITQGQLQRALHEAQARVTNEKIISQNEVKWTDVMKNHKRRSQPPKRLGTAKVGNSEFSGTDKKVWIYLYRIKSSATEQKITDHIMKNDSFSNEKIVVKDIPGVPDKPKRFVVCAPFSKKDQLYDPEFWPENVGIRRFDFKKHHTFLQQQTASFL